MENSGWRYYNHAIIPNCAPHEKVDTTLIDNEKIWDISKKALLVRYTTDFDCGYETNWWHCIKDTPIDLESMKAKKRYRINKGLSNVEVKKVSAKDYADEIYECFEKALERYEGKKNSSNRESFVNSLKKDTRSEYYVCIFKETNEVVGYARNIVYDEYVDFASMKFIPSYMKYEISAALIYTMIYDYINVQGKKYVYDGERTISHKTSIQDYLESVFDFKKAYCNLHIVYRKKIGRIIKIIFPFRKVLKLFDKIKFFANINSVLLMEEIVRNKKGLSL